MRLLLDTHILVWLATDRPRLSRGERAALDENASELFVSALSLVELRAKARSERRRGVQALPLDPAGAITFCARFDITVDPVIGTDTTIALEQDPVHGDPFDEMLLAHAQRLGARLLTRDDKLLGHPLVYSS